MSNSVIEPIVASGSWSDPKTGDLHEQHLTVEQLKEWIDWIPGFIAVINSGAVDHMIYEIAGACHVRHLATDGKATPDRPMAPADDSLPLTSIPDTQQLHMGMIRPLSAGPSGSRVFTYNGRHYSKTRLVAKCFHAADTFNPALHGAWLRIEDFGTDHFKVRIVTEPAGPGVACGQMLLVKFDSVDHLFAN